MYAPATLPVTLCEGVPIVRGEQFLRHTTVVAGPPLDKQVSVSVGASYVRLVTVGSPVCVCVCVCVCVWVGVGGCGCGCGCGSQLLKKQSRYKSPQ